jgi:hypothetical protein
MKLLPTIVYVAVRWASGPENFDQLATLIKELIYSDLPGEEKKKRVQQFVLTELSEFRGSFGMGWGIVLDLIIAVVRVKYELPFKVK